MPRKKLSINKLKSKLLSFLLVFSPLFFLGIIFYFFSGLFMPPFDSYANTILAPDFTWEEFNQIKIGDSKENTLKKLGKPLWIRNVHGKNELECLQYTRGNKIPFFNFDEYIAEVCIDTNQIVVATHIFY